MILWLIFRANKKTCWTIKLIFKQYEELTNLRIIIHKSAIYFPNLFPFFYFKDSKFSFKYLGTLVAPRRILVFMSTPIHLLSVAWMPCEVVS